MSTQANANAAALSVRFFLLPVKDEIETKKMGRPIFNDVEVCEVRFAGNREKVGHFPAHEIAKTERDMDGNVNELTYAMIYNPQYLAFRNGDASPITGTLTSELPFLSKSQCLMLKALNIHTAEALAGLDGANLKTLGMGGREWKNQAQAYLEKAREGADVSVLASRLARLEAENAALKARKPGAVADEAAEDPLAAPEDPNASPFFSMGADDIKNWIAEATGSRPKGNPSHATLVTQADAVNADLKKKRESVAA